MAEKSSSEIKKKLEIHYESLKNDDTVKTTCGKDIKIITDYSNQECATKPNTLFRFADPQSFATIHLLFVGIGTTGCESCCPNGKKAMWFLAEDLDGVLSPPPAFMEFCQEVKAPEEETVN